MRNNKQSKHAIVTFLFTMFLIITTDRYCMNDDSNIVHAFKELDNINHIAVSDLKEETCPVAGLSLCMIQYLNTEIERHKVDPVATPLYADNNMEFEPAKNISEVIINEQERINQIESITADPYDITKVSNLTEEQYYILTEGTWLEGKGYEQALMELEKTHNINAMYAMAVSTLESDHGTSRWARELRNFYGAHTNRSFTEFYDNTMYFGDFQNRLYVDEGLTSVYSIGPKYCPPNRQWEIIVADKMKKYLNKVVSTLK